MTSVGQIAKPTALFLALVSMTCLSGVARAETGWLWFDSVLAAPTTRAAPAHHYVQRAKPARTTTVTPVAKPILVSAVASQPRSYCFWCNRPVYVSGLSF